MWSWGLSNHHCERREGLGTERSVFKYVLYNLAISLDDQKSDIYAETSASINSYIN